MNSELRIKNAELKTQNDSERSAQDKEVKLSVKNLKISFRTDGGKVQAVRNINFDLYKGETLAIVGESGSGKSVTSRAILGILANNAIKEGGEILYDGQDLMKISEEEFCKIRGDKIAMIFQDPLSSLNPIMRVGKQMTEAMIINGRLNQKNCRKDFNGMLAELNRCMNSSFGDDNIAKDHNKQLCRNFDKFEYKHLELENAYLAAKEAASEGIDAIEDVLFHIEKNALAGLQAEIKEIINRANKSYNAYVVSTRADELKAEVDNIKKLIASSFGIKLKNAIAPIFNRNYKYVDKTDYAAVAVSLGKIKDILAEAVASPEPNFFSMGYYMTFAGQPLPEKPIEELNAYLHEYLDNNFMLEFIRTAKQGMIYSANRSTELKKTAIKVIDDKLAVFGAPDLDRKSAVAAAKAMVEAVEAAIDKLDTVKDNISYTFRSSIKAAIETYFGGIVRNKKEEKRYARQSQSYERKVASGKTPSWKVADKSLVDLDEVRGDIRTLVMRIKAKFERDIENAPSVDFDAKAVDMIDYLKLKASGVAHKVTQAMAKARALKLMFEVGIPEPRKRYRQYPFEFSGGMRQRIVIAIALSASPDILICDEPTTALDVTIQSQILELINKVKAERKLSVIFITHDLGVVANMADRVAVMYAGKIVEIGTSDDIFYSPAHPYTWALLSSMPDLDTKEKLEAIPGTPPNMIYPPRGDAFAERNKYAMQIDFEEQPPMFTISDTHSAATWLLHPNAPKVDMPKIIIDRIARMKKAAAAANDTTEALHDLDETTDAVTEEEKGVKAKKGKVAADADKLIESEANVVSLDAKNGGVVADFHDEIVATKEPTRAVSPKKPALKKPPARNTVTKSAPKSASTAKKSNSSNKAKNAKNSSGAAKSASTEKSTTGKKSAKNGKKEG